MKKISSASSLCNRVAMLRLSLGDFPRESRLFRKLSRRSPVKTSVWTKSTVTFTLAQPILVLVWEHLFTLISLDGPRSVLMLCRDVVKSFTSSPAEPVENLVHRLGYSEVELVQKMIDGVNTLWKEDQAFQGGAPA